MTTLQELLQLPKNQQEARGLVHTPHEIAQQPDTWSRTLAIFRHEQARICAFLEALGLGPVPAANLNASHNANPNPNPNPTPNPATPTQKPVVLLVGAGTSDYIGQTLALLLRQHWQCEVIACASTDLLPSLEQYVVAGRTYLWIAFSRSGDSPEGVAVIEQALERHPSVAHLIVTCNPAARMLSIAPSHPRVCALVLDDAVNDRSLAMTSSFTNMLVLGHCLAHAWSLADYEPVLTELQAAGRAFLGTGFALAHKLSAQRFSRICLVGIGPLAAVAKESALKVLEMSAGQVKTMAETTLGLRHGPMAALDRETLFLCFLANDAYRQGYAADLLRELGDKQVTASRVVVGPASAQAAFAPLCETYLPVQSDAPDSYRAIVDVIFGQLLGLCTSIEHGLHPDAPSPGGVIHRVVQEFAIYR